MIDEILNFIYEQTGVIVESCEYFCGIREHRGHKYFNVVLKQKLSESADFSKLERFADKYNSIRIEPNGLRRVAIFF
jgi:hypothetical protein